VSDLRKGLEALEKQLEHNKGDCEGDCLKCWLKLNLTKLLALPDDSAAAPAPFAVQRFPLVAVEGTESTESNVLWNPVPGKCPDCNGTGLVPAPLRFTGEATCYRCEGTGRGGGA